MQRILSHQLAHHVGETVTIAGWVHRRRRLRAVEFLIVRDRAGLTQVVVAPGALDDLTGSVEGLSKDAETRLARGRRSVSEALEGRRPATHEDIAKVRAELRAIGRRLDAIEERLPARRAASGKSGAGKAPAKKPAAKRTRPKQNPA